MRLAIAGYLIGAWLTFAYMLASGIPGDPAWVPKDGDKTELQIAATLVWPAFWFFHSAYLIAETDDS